MCQPDTTVEVKDEELGGVTGFGTTHRCWKWEHLMEWTGEWQWFGYVPREGKEMDKGKEGGMGHHHLGHGVE